MLKLHDAFLRRLSAAIALLLSCLFVLLGGATVAHAADDFLDPAVAFKFSATERPGEIEVRYKVADGYYMYRERFAFAVKNGAATLGEAQLPAGKVHFDQTFNKDVETYRGDLVIRIPVRQASGPFDLAVTSQGCADQGICYPPMERIYRVSGAALKAADANAAAAAPSASDAPWYDRATNADYAQSLLEDGGFFAVIGLFFVAGVVLSLLPCSYPMIPILSAIIIGEGARVTRARGFGLSVAYVFGMALVYTALGVAAALIGQSLGAWLQNPWVLGAFASLLTIFALTLIAGYDITLPERWQSGVNQASQKRSGGKLAAVVVMGALSALVVGACMTAPLFAVLAFIAHTGNAVLGGAALFSMGIGLGVPLLIIGLGAGSLLPRAGTWMDGVKVFFGVVLLAAALWIVWPVLGGVAQMLLGALWLLIAAAALGLFAAGTATVTIWRRLGRGLGAALAIWAATLLVGLAAGSTDPLRPLAVFAARGTPNAEAQTQGPVFARVRTSTELDLAVKAAARPAMLDFYADWCVSCKEMEHLTFSDPRVRERLAQLNLLRADVTANNADDQALLRRFKLFGPPGIIFFDAQGNEVARVVGYEPADKFLKSLDKAAART
ncbi:Cytochrome c-type biogenesis protein DsbD, protein-disulfide reductase [Caballeronia glathei]|uniref:Thiol:disulfide interchange protein DsbD n=1 Tax=Caballeronia glathei TaxID=60547 RepID=A0A069PCG6_9BURK|nr:protein-disulfide reductase DsbD [Caballeronia glathei]KDR38147.1 thiol:disulfide interchange protein [Caballeronia glathei]CDY76366.1 Cytochrome c-type biogenesis protein DsbD, protein-disulfide reductase [Caballeronia glathei]